jgi:hypothetical protein
MPDWIHACDLPVRRLVANLRFLPIENLPALVAYDQTMQFDRLGSSALCLVIITFSHSVCL